ncbi:hypothetical protein FV226_15590 [Methylobacterium sp. WL12]|uniref:hypothetical protein n=1 Tax=Methylobacterium sp. WL12 TaxID=2603890 RepID=UPI0011CA3D29|nr:hypothetical protein [Methylobacterium sp. WL12]TXM71367.1 hypothetical protein FV226_15590 [Methylobacterium sp. WL12]
MCDLVGIAAVLKAVAWPIAVLILTFFTVFNFKQSISDFIRRIIKAEASASGVKTELQANIQAAPPEASQPKIEDGKIKQASPLNEIYMTDFLI